MTASAHTPGAQAPPQMAHEPEPPTAAAIPPPAEPAAGAAAPPAEPAGRSGLRAQITESPLMTLLVGAMIALLSFNLYTSREDINELEDDVEALAATIDARFQAQDAKFDARFAAFEAKIEARFAAFEAKIEAKIEAKFAAQDAKIDEINLKLTALIAHLGKSAEVEAAVENGADPTG